ncbi:hypothetical protein PspLS_09817 [Pyricularia sp. CBS 133598]|nr:hypothetical protein PspLS_09817 [Pyricularia sp. CBS 133598]
MSLRAAVAPLRQDGRGLGSGRPQPAATLPPFHMGLFTKTLELRLDAAADDAFESVLSRTKDRIRRATLHSRVRDSVGQAHMAVL